MRISTSQMNQQATNSILEAQAKLAKTQLMLSTGKRMVTPSDDPRGASQVLALNQSLAVTDQYQRNADVAKTRLGQEENALIGIQDILQRVREQALQANNASQTNGTRKSIALDIDQALSQLVALANSKDSSNNYMFAGFQEQTQPFTSNADGSFTYNGDDGQRFVQIGAARQIATSDSGSDLFRAIKNGNGTFGVAENTANTGSGIVDPGSVINSANYDGDAYNIQFAVNPNANAALAFTDNGTNDNLGYTLTINGTTVYTASENTPPINTIEGLAAEISLSSGTTGVQARVADGVLYLSNTVPGAGTITLTESISGATAGDDDRIVGYFGSVLNSDSGPTTAVITYDDSAVDSYVVLDSQNNIEIAGAYQEEAAITFNGITTSVKGTPDLGDRFNVTPSVNQDMFTTLRNIAVTLKETDGGNEIGRITINNALIRGLTDLDRAMGKVEDVRSRVGARINAIDTQSELNADFKLTVQATKSKIEDLDFVTAVTQFKMQQTALEAAQQTYIQLQGLSLFDYL